MEERKHSEDLYSLLGIQSVADVVRRGRIEMVWASGAQV